MFFRKNTTFEAPNLLRGHVFSSKEREIETGLLLMFTFLCALFLIPFQVFQWVGVLFLSILILVAVFLKLEWGMYALAFFSLFQGFEIAFSRYQITKNIAFLSSLNAPLVDFISLVLVASSLCILIFVQGPRWSRLKHLKWPVFLYACFLGVATYSAFHSGVVDTSLGLKNIFRPLLFLMISFVFLPHFFIQSEKTLLNVFKLLFWTGCGIALFGLSSLFVVTGSGWMRIQPYGIGSFTPLGVNHNLLAEVLIAIIPIGLYLISLVKTENTEESLKRINRLILGTGLMLVVALGTLSRAAWVSLFSEAVVFFVLFQDQFQILWKKIKKSLFLPVCVMLSLMMVYMGIFLNSSVVASSDSSRVEVTKMVLFYVARSPLFGYGPGSFVPMIQDTYVHTVEFGDALDAHGFIQKIGMEEGTLGLFFFGAFLFSIFLLLFLRQKETKNLSPKFLLVMLTGVVVFQLFNTSYFNSVMWLPLGLALVSLRFSKE
jgi:hypothetical protein